MLGFTNWPVSPVRRMLQATSFLTLPCLDRQARRLAYGGIDVVTLTMNSIVLALFCEFVVHPSLFTVLQADMKPLPLFSKKNELISLPEGSYNTEFVASP